jgi:hypothetical protein
MEAVTLPKAMRKLIMPPVQLCLQYNLSKESPKYSPKYTTLFWKRDFSGVLFLYREARKRKKRKTTTKPAYIHWNLQKCMELWILSILWNLVDQHIICVYQYIISNRSERNVSAFFFCFFNIIVIPWPSRSINF